MFQQGLIFITVVALAAGCATRSKKSASNWEDEPAFVAVPAIPAEPSAPPAPPMTPTPPTEPAVPASWVDLTSWSRDRGFGPVQLMSAADPTTFRLSSTNGSLVFKAGSQTAFWNGLELRLGFGPRLTNGQPVVHPVDLEKNFHPLLAGPTAPLFPVGVIVIDPGHGGDNSGTRSVQDPRFEKAFTLDWALRLAPLLADQGWTVYLTRTNDASVSLADRIAFAAEHQADLFISLHFNSSGGGNTQSGIETYCLTPAGLPSTLVRNGPDEPGIVLPNNTFDNDNLHLAVRIHRELVKLPGAKDRGIRRARFMTVLRGQTRPAVLLEGGYLSNPAEAALIATPAFRQKLAEAVAKALAPAKGTGPGKPASASAHAIPSPQ